MSVSVGPPSSRSFTVMAESWEAVGRSLTSYDPGVELFEQDSLPQAVFLLQSGWVKLVRLEPNGAEAIIDIPSGPEILGSCAVILGRPYPFAARTITRCLARRISAEEFRMLIETDPDCKRQVLFRQSQTLYERAFRIAELACLHARERMEYVISRLTDAAGTSNSNRRLRARFPLRDHELAELLSITPEHLSRLLHQLMREGILARERGWIVVIEPGKLRSREVRHLQPYRQRAICAGELS